MKAIVMTPQITVAFVTAVCEGVGLMKTSESFSMRSSTRPPASAKSSTGM